MEKLDKIAEKLYLYGRIFFAGGRDMAELLDETLGSNLQEKKFADAAKASARIKRMRGWLGVKSTSSHGGYADDSGGVVYGDGHSGWNR
jgi:hypothetical protein